MLMCSLSNGYYSSLTSSPSPTSPSSACSEIAEPTRYYPWSPDGRRAASRGVRHRIHYPSQVLGGWSFAGRGRRILRGRSILAQDFWYL